MLRWDSKRVDEAIMRLGRIGYDNVAGYLQDGMAALQHLPGVVSNTPRIAAAAIRDLDGTPTVIDIRTPSEWEGGTSRRA